MPVEFHWDLASSLLRTTISGAVSETQFLQYIRDIWSNPQRAKFDEIADCREMQVAAMTPALMLKSAQLSRELNTANERFRVAFVVSGTLGYGVGRQYETYREATLAETRMFESMEAAETWILCERARTQTERNAAG